MGCNGNMCQNLNAVEFVLDESGTNEAEFHRKVVSGRKIASAGE